MRADLYDVAIVGADPAGATCAYYLARAGRRRTACRGEALALDEQHPR
jgi:flavin-dependent dehydrogenase